MSLAFVAVLACSFASNAAVARMQQAPASRVVMDLPEGYKPARLFTGFVNETASVSLVVLEMPSLAYEQLANGLTPQALAAKGDVNAVPGKLDRPEPYLFMRGEQASAQGPVAKFFVAFKNKRLTALISANVRKTALDDGSVKIGDIERILASAAITPVATPARAVYRLGYLGRFQPAGTILGTTGAYTLDGKFEPTGGDRRALLLVSPSLEQQPVRDPDTQAETLLRGIPGLKAFKIADRRRITVSGMPAVEIVGSATDSDSGGDVSLYQVLVLPPQGGYYRLLGQVPPNDDGAELMAELKKIAQSFRIVE